ncbi:hypothetical protein [Streptomyces sp. NPDC049906]
MSKRAGFEPRVGTGRKHPVLIRAGDQVRCSVEDIGDLVAHLTGP